MKKYIFLVFLFLSLFTVSVNAQAVENDPCLTALEKEADLRKRTEIERDSYKAQLERADKQISWLEKQVATLEKIVANLDTQNNNNNQIDLKTQMIIDNLRVQVAEYKAELEETRRDLERARRNGNIKMAVGFGAGVFTGTKIN